MVGAKLGRPAMTENAHGVGSVRLHHLTAILALWTAKLAPNAGTPVC